MNKWLTCGEGESALTSGTSPLPKCATSAITLDEIRTARTVISSEDRASFYYGNHFAIEVGLSVPTDSAAASLITASPCAPGTLCPYTVKVNPGEFSPSVHPDRKAKQSTLICAPLITAASNPASPARTFMRTPPANGDYAPGLCTGICSSRSTTAKLRSAMSDDSTGL